MLTIDSLLFALHDQDVRFSINVIVYTNSEDRGSESGFRIALQMIP